MLVNGIYQENIKKRNKPIKNANILRESSAKKIYEWPMCTDATTRHQGNRN